MPNSFFDAWNSERSSGACDAIFNVAMAMAVAALAAMLDQRTRLLEGAGPNPLWWAPLAAGILLIAALPASVPIDAGRRQRWLLLLLPVALAAPLPSQARIGLGSLGCAGLAACIQRAAMRRIAGLFMATAAGWGAALVADAAYQHAAARLSDYSWLALPLTTGLRLLGADVEWDGDDVVSTGIDNSARILSSPDKFGGEFLIGFVAALAVIAIVRRVRFRSIAAALALIASYAILRTAWLISALSDPWHDMRLWWDEGRVAMTYLPCALFLVFALRSSSSSVLPRSAHSSGPFRKSCLPLSALGAFLLMLGWLWADPGAPKAGRVLVDEHYSRWEWSEDPIDARRFGVKTVYSYYNLVEALGHYYEVGRNFDEITDQALADVDVLILKTPTSPYSSSALESIWRFVDRGGGVWLIGDHTNVFGMCEYLNMVSADRFGIRFRQDAVVDPAANRQLFQSRPESHPIVRRMPLFVWMTSDSLSAPWMSHDVILSPRLLVDNPDFSQNTNFGDFVPQLDERIGPVTQAVALTFGKGRVAAWSDSTVFSNFGVFMPGKFELALGFVDWLNRTNASWPIRMMLVLGGLGMLALALLGFSTQSMNAGIWIGAACGILAAARIADASFPQLRPHVPFAKVAYIERDPRQSYLPTLTTFDQGTEVEYLTSFIDAQRVGKRPFVCRSLAELGECDKAVIVGGDYGPWAASEVESLLRFVKDGGTLLLLDAGKAHESLLSPVSQAMNVRLQPYVFRLPPELEALAAKAASEKSAAGIIMPKGPAVAKRDGTALLPTSIRFTIEGGEAAIVLRDEPKKAVAARAKVGKGSVVLTGTATFFSDASAAENSAIPNPTQLAIQQMLFDWFAMKE